MERGKVERRKVGKSEEGVGKMCLAVCQCAPTKSK